MTFNYLSYLEEKSGKYLPEDHPLKVRLQQIHDAQLLVETQTKQKLYWKQLDEDFLSWMRNAKATSPEEGVNIVRKLSTAEAPSLEASILKLMDAWNLYPNLRYQGVEPFPFNSIEGALIDLCTKVSGTTLSPVITTLPKSEFKTQVLLEYSKTNYSHWVYTALGQEGPEILEQLTKTQPSNWIGLTPTESFIFLFAGSIEAQSQVVTKSSFTGDKLPVVDNPDIQILIEFFGFLWKKPHRGATKKEIYDIIPIACKALDPALLDWVIRNASSNQTQKIKNILWNWVRKTQFDGSNEVRYQRTREFLRYLYTNFHPTRKEMYGTDKWDYVTGFNNPLSALLLFDVINLDILNTFTRLPEGVIHKAYHLASTYQLKFEHTQHLWGYSPITQVRPDVLYRIEGIPASYVLEAIQYSQEQKNTSLPDYIVQMFLHGVDQEDFYPTILDTILTFPEQAQFKLWEKVFNSLKQLKPATSLQSSAFLLAQSSSAVNEPQLKDIVDLIEPEHYKHLKIIPHTLLSIYALHNHITAVEPILDYVLSQQEPDKLSSLLQSSSVVPEKVVGKLLQHGLSLRKSWGAASYSILFTLTKFPKLLHQVLLDIADGKITDYPSVEGTHVERNLIYVMHQDRVQIEQETSLEFYQELLNAVVNIWPKDKAIRYIDTIALIFQNTRANETTPGLEIVEIFKNTAWAWNSLDLDSEESLGKILQRLAQSQSNVVHNLLPFLASKKVNIFTTYKDRTIFDYLPEDEAKSIIDIFIDAHQQEKTENTIEIDILLA